MKKLDEYIRDITSKDETKAIDAAKYLLDNSDIELFKALSEKTAFLFDFIKDNVSKRLIKSSNKDNYKNIFNFFNTYSDDFDDTFAQILAQYADEQLTDYVLDILENGNIEQKTYASKYFTYIPDTVATEILREYCFSDFENLSFNASQALGKMDDQISFEAALKKLGSDDDFEKLKAVKFFVAFQKRPPLDEIFDALRSSSMPENIAGQIPYLVNLVSLLKTDKIKNTIITIENIISGLGEILPLSQIFQIELYEIIEQLIEINQEENKYRSKISQILLKALAKIETICKNDEYTFDEDKNTKQELNDIYKLLNDQPELFWDTQKANIIEELDHCRHRILSALEVIKEFKLKSTIEKMKGLLEHDNEIVICEVASTLKELGALSEVDKSKVLNKITDKNIYAIIESYWGTDGA